MNHLGGQRCCTANCELRRKAAGRGTTTGGELKAVFGASKRQVEPVVTDGNDLGIAENAYDPLIQRAVCS